MATPTFFSSIHKIYTLLSSEERKKGLLIIGLALLTSCLELATASMIVLLAQVINQPETGITYLERIGLREIVSSQNVILIFAVFVGIIYAVKNTIAALEAYFQNFTIQKINYNFKKRLLHKYAAADYSFHLTRNTAYGLQVINGDAELTFSSGLISIASLITEGIIFFCLICLVVVLNPSLALTIFIIGLVLGLAVSKFLLPLFYSYGLRLQSAAGEAQKNLIQYFHAFKEIVVLGKSDFFIDAFDIHSRKKSRVQALQNTINALPRMIIEVLFVGLFVVTIAFLSLRNETPANMVGLLGGYLYVGFRLIPGLNRIVYQMNIFKSIMPCIDRIHQEFTSMDEMVPYKDVRNFEFKKFISLKNVSYRYRNGSEEALSNVDFTIKKGQTIGIIGETGSGKSTLVDLILGLLHPTQGQILIDDRFPVHCSQWHKIIGYVPQSIYLIDDTIEANIAFGESEIDPVLLKQAAKAAQLDSLIAKLPQGFLTYVGDRGIRLSGGERQRIAIARALYRNPEVLIFDEATSALDNETEKKLIDTIYELSKSHTVIMIAHRHSTLDRCDTLIRIEDKKVIEVGNR